MSRRIPLRTFTGVGALALLLGLALGGAPDARSEPLTRQEQQFWTGLVSPETGHPNTAANRRPDAASGSGARDAVATQDEAVDHGTRTSTGVPVEDEIIGSR